MRGSGVPPLGSGHARSARAGPGGRVHEGPSGPHAGTCLRAPGRRFQGAHARGGTVESGRCGSCGTHGRGQRGGGVGGHAEAPPARHTDSRRPVRAPHTSLSTDTHGQRVCTPTAGLTGVASGGGGAAGLCPGPPGLLHGTGGRPATLTGHQRQQNNNAAGQRRERLTAHGYKTPAHG